MRTNKLELAICKRQSVFKVAAPVLTVVALVLVVPAGLYADTGTWADGDMPVLTVDQVSTTLNVSKPCFTASYTYFTYGTNSNSIGHNVDSTGCETQNSLGSFINSNSNSTSGSYDFVQPGTSIAFRVLHPGGRQISITPIPNQPGFIWEEPHPVSAFTTPHFFSNFAGNGTFSQFFYGSNIVPWDLAYELETAGATLHDANGQLIYMKSYAFSQNGQWMVIEGIGLGLIRVNTMTHAMQLIDQTKLTYNLGLTPHMALAISDDGNSVVRSTNLDGSTVVYDLSHCQLGSFVAGANNVTAIQGCSSRNVQQSLQAQLSNFQYLQNMHYGADGKNLSAVAINTGLNGITLYNRVRYSVAGYQQPHLSYLALGDSFSSGEGTYDYLEGTNSTENSCHLSSLSYPYVTAAALGIADFHSVACSGAVSGNYYSKQGNQSRVEGSSLGDWIPGYRPQGEYFEFSGKTSIVTISMIGNDIGFADKLKRCLLVDDSCFHYKEDRQSIADEIYGKFSTLVSLYRNIKKDSGDDDVKVYVLGYPQILGTGPTCTSNVPFNQEERQMAQGLIAYLNAVIKAATISAGVQYIDVEHTFDGHRLCESLPNAVNGLSIDGGVIHSVADLGSIANSSFHPDPQGHQLMSQALLTQSDDFTKPMPAESLVHVPYVESPEYEAFVDSAPSGSTVERLVYVGTQVATGVIRGGVQSFDIDTTVAKPQSEFKVYFNSDPTYAGMLISDENGAIIGNVTVPASLEPGYHTIHLYGQNIANQDIDMYETIYVAASEGDFNGDGVPNNQDPCLIVPPSGVDSDHDGIDDACDGDIEPTPIDTVPPVVTGVVDRLPEHNGWYNRDATISWSAADPDPSSGSPTQPSSTLANIEGDNTYISDESCDPAGNCATGSIELKLDKTPPDITYTVDPAPNAEGWNNSMVTVHFTCIDALSGVESCSDPIAVSGADGSYVVAGSATDKAGNVSGVNVIVNLDETAPQVMNYISSTPNQNGWHNHDVTVTPSCSDNLSGIATCGQPVTVSQEGANQSITSNATDYAGNTASASTAVNIDKTSPAISSMTWTNNPKASLGIATLTVHTTDNLSGAQTAEYFLGDTDPGVGHGAQMTSIDDTFTASFGSDLPTGVYKISVRAQDRAGNWSTATGDYLVVYDPFSVRMTGKKSFIPSLANGDSLPGLASNSQTDAATFAFSVGYDKNGDPLSNDLRFSYETGTDCKRSDRAQNCHSLQLGAVSTTWFVASGINNSVGTFAGTASLTIDGIAEPVQYVVTGLDGDRLGVTTADHLTLKIFAPDDNLSTATPLYEVSDDVSHGNIHIQT